MALADVPPELTRHATCLGCGCLCDDITVAVAAGRVVEAERACVIGSAWFLRPDPGAGGPLALADGQAVSQDEALDRAAAILKAARSPLVWGLTSSSIEAVGVALAVADQIGATVDLAGSARRASHRAAFIRVGAVSSTLGEVRDRAGVVLFWGNHPDSTHPRHAERYSVASLGRFLSEDRRVIVVDVGPEPPAGVADLRVSIAPEAQADAFRVMLALSRGVTLDPARVARATGQPLVLWATIIDRLRSVPSSAIFFGPAIGSLSASGWEAGLLLVQALNSEGRRCVGLSLGEPGNVVGAESVLCWQAGAPGAIDFAAGLPEYRPLEATLSDRIRMGEVDALLAVGLDPRTELAADLVNQLGSIPWIQIVPGACDPAGLAPGPTVAIDVGRLGLEVAGTVARVDGVLLPLRPALAGSKSSDRTILQAILDRMQQATFRPDLPSATVPGLHGA